MTYKLIIPLFIFFSFSIVSYPQSKKELEVQDFFWGENDTQKNNTQVPEKWKNESAVILYEEYYKEFRRFQKTIKITNGYRRRIKLNDQNAVTEFSDFTFTKKFLPKYGYHTWKNKGENTIGAKIIKPSGEEIIVDVDSEAIKVDDEYKLAIPNLQIGDIIDVFLHSFSKTGFVGVRSFDPETRILNQEYPIKKFVLKIDTGNGYFINFDTYNGAPELREEENEKSNRKLYELVAEDLEKTDFPRWYYPYRDLPYFKMKVNYAKSSALGIYKSSITDFRSDDAKTVQKSVTAGELLEFAKKEGYQFINPYNDEKWFAKEFQAYIDEKEFSGKEIARNLYNYIRHFDYTQFFQMKILKDSKIEYDSNISDNEKVFGQHKPPYSKNFQDYARVLRANEIKYECIVLLPRDEGDIDDLLYNDEKKVLLKLKLPNEDVVVTDTEVYSSYGSYSPLFENTEGYLLTYDDDNTKILDLKRVEFPKSSYNDNIEKEHTLIKISDNMSLDIKKKSECFGHLKSDHQDDLLSPFDVLKEDYDHYSRPTYIEQYKFKKKNRERVMNEYSSLEKKSKQNWNEHLKEKLQNEYDTEIQDYEYSIENSGRYQKNDPFVIEENFNVIDDFIKKAGESYLFEIGRFIGGQVAINEDEKQRKEDIYMDYPKTYENTIEVEIPEGYTVQGLENLSKNVENATGGFVSSAKMDGSKLIVNTKKYYRNYFEENKNWSLMISFLDAAYQFSQEKILLKKI